MEGGRLPQVFVAGDGGGFDDAWVRLEWMDVEFEIEIGN